MTEPGNSATQSSTKFRFSEEDREQILSQVSGTQSVITSATTEANDVVARLESLKRKETTLNLHLSTLVDYIKAERVPRGLRSNLIPNLLTEDKEFVENWYGISNQYSQDLMYLMVKHLQKKIQQLQKEIGECELELLNTYPAERCRDIAKTIEGTVQRLKENIVKTKARKFERDARDYEMNEVYSWNKKKRSTKNQKKRQSSTTSQNPSAESTSTDSEEGTSTGTRRKKRSFLGQRNQRSGDRTEGTQATVHPPENQRPQTRSRTRQDRGRGRGPSRR